MRALGCNTDGIKFGTIMDGITDFSCTLWTGGNGGSEVMKRKAILSWFKSDFLLLFFNT